MSVVVVFVSWQTAYLASKLWGFGSDFFSGIHPKALDAIEAISIGIFAVWGLLWLPSQRHEVQEKKRKDDIEVLEKNHADTIRKIQTENVHLRRQLDALAEQQSKADKLVEDRQHNKTTFGRHLEALHNRSLQIGALDMSKCDMDKEDNATFTLFMAIYSDLERLHTKAEAAMFKAAKSGNSQAATGIVDAKAFWRQHHMENVNAKYAELKRIIERLD